MVSVTDGSVKVFQMFEPCHKGDRLAPELEAKGCEGLLLQLFNCNFTGVYKLWGWSPRAHGHDHRNGASKKYSPSDAATACADADLIAIKTISYAHDVKSEAFPILEAEPDLRMIDVVRDPRSIVASTWKTRGFYDVTLLGMCDAFCANMNVSHERMHRVVYEHLTENPEVDAAGVYDFLGVPFGNAESQWVADNFNADCGSRKVQAAFDDCRRNSTSHIARYVGILKNDQYAAFMGTETCRNVSFHYEYDPWYYNHADSRFFGKLALLVQSMALMMLSLAVALGL